MALITSSSPHITTLENLIKQQTSLITKLLTNANKDKAPYHEWKYKAPAQPTDIRHHNGKIFRWCTKCNGGQGQWASAHNTKTHVDGFHQERGKSGSNNRYQRGGPTRGTNALTAQSEAAHTGIHEASLNDMYNQVNQGANQAHLDLAATLDPTWRFDVSDDLDP